MIQLVPNAFHYNFEIGFASILDHFCCGEYSQFVSSLGHLKILIIISFDQKEATPLDTPGNLLLLPASSETL